MNTRGSNWIEECRRYLLQVRDVLSVNIVTDDDGQIVELHVLAESNRHPKQIARDIETFLRVEYNLDVDHKKISIVQLNDHYTIPQSEPRLQFIRLSVSYLKGEQMLVEVELEKGQDKYLGTAQGAGSAENGYRLVAQAALSALMNSFAGTIPTLSLDAITIVNMGMKKVVVVLVTYILKGKQESISGCAIIYQEEKEAVVKAVLDAVNRRITAWDSLGRL